MPTVTTISFSYREMAAVMARLQCVNPLKVKAFEGRLQQLQRLGLPPGTNVGRAGRARYQYWKLAEIDAYLCFLDAGVTPALLQVHFAERPLYSSIYGQYVESAEDGLDHHVGMKFNALGQLRSADPDRAKTVIYDHEIYSGYGPTFFAGLSDSPSVVIDLTGRIVRLKSTIAEFYPQYAEELVFPGPPGFLFNGKA